MFKRYGQIYYKGKFMKNSILFVLILNSFLYASTIKQGQKLQITGCDEHQWCHIKGTKFYIKGFKYKKNGNTVTLKPQFDDASYYKRTQDGDSYGFVETSGPSNSQKNEFLTQKAKRAKILAQEAKAKKLKKYKPIKTNIRVIPSVEDEQIDTKYIETKKLDTIKPGDKIIVESCDEYRWCKVAKTEYYIRGHKFDFVGKEFFLKKRYSEAFYYVNVNKKVFGYKKAYDTNEIDTLKPLKDEEPQEKIDTLQPLISEDVEEMQNQQEDEEVFVYNKMGQKEISNEDPEDYLAREDTASTNEDTASTISKSNFYLSLGIGFGKTDIDINIPESFLSEDIDKSSIGIDMGAGVEYDTFLFGANYEYQKTNSYNIKSYFLDINYKLYKDDIYPYVGIFAGYSKLLWDKSPIKTTTDTKLDSQDATYGAQIGIVKDINKHIDIRLYYRYAKQNFKTDITNSSNYIKHNSTNSLIMGVKYVF